MRRLIAAVGLILCCLVVFAWYSGEVPRWQAGGSANIAHPSLKAVGKFPLVLGFGARIIVQGDSNVLGRMRNSKPRPWPLLLQLRFGSAVQVVMRGHGGDTAATGSMRWPIEARPGDVAILLYGSNDAAPRGALAFRKPVSPAQFSMTLAKLVRTYKERGAMVVVLGPPPAGSEAMDRRIAPYRTAARNAAIEAEANFLDPVAAFGDQPGRPPVLTADALHLNEEGALRLAAWLGNHIVLSP